MKRWKGRSLCSMTVIPSLELAWVAFCLIGPLWWTMSAWAQKSADQSNLGQSTQVQTGLSALEAELDRYIHKGYLVVGPVTLTQYDGAKLAVYRSSGDIVIDLRNKKLTVKDGNARSTSVDTIKRGGKVYVCSGPNEVVLYVQEKRGGATNVAH